ncbi:MAG: hypothetical protein ACFCU8_20075 [Thermosynechococcaceae cyanobacterium]
MKGEASVKVDQKLADQEVYLSTSGRHGWVRGANNETMRLIDLQGQLVEEFKRPDLGGFDISPSGDRIAGLSSKGEIQVQDLNGTIVLSFKGHFHETQRRSIRHPSTQRYGRALGSQRSADHDLDRPHPAD